MKQTLNVQIENSKNGYKINISDENIQTLISDIEKSTSGRKRLFVLSRKVHKLYKKELNINKEELLVLDDGEQTKNIKSYLKILNTLLSKGLTRDDVIIAIKNNIPIYPNLFIICIIIDLYY